jgi:hypothetical protein
VSVVEVAKFHFNGGEWAPELLKRYDHERHAAAQELCKNWIPRLYGKAYTRPGTEFLSTTYKDDKKVRLIPFQFSVTQTYMIELGDYYYRIIKDGAYVVWPSGMGTDIVEAATFQWTQRGASQTYYLEALGGGDPGLASGKPVTIYEDVGGADTELPEAYFSDTLGLEVAGTWAWGDYDSLGFDTVYVRLTGNGDPDAQADGYLEAGYIVTMLGGASGGSPFLEADLPYVKYAQKADTMYLVAPGQKPQKLTRTDHHLWSMDDVDYGAGVAAPATPTISSLGRPQNYRRPKYRWTDSGTTSGEYFIEIGAGGDAELPDKKPLEVWLAGTARNEGTLGSLLQNEWGYGRQGTDGVARDHVYVRTSGTVDPDPLADGYVQIRYGEWEVVVTSVSATGEESEMSGSIVCDLEDVITWTAVTGASKYRIYRKVQGRYFYIGETDTNSYTVEDVEEDQAKGPPFEETPFASAYPGACCFFDQRMFYGRTNDAPNTVWGSIIGFYDNLNTSVPLRDDDGLSFAIDDAQMNEILNMVAMQSIIAFTSGGEWTIAPGSASGTITPSSIKARLRGSIGSDHLRPLVVKNRILFLQRGGRKVHELTFSFDLDGFEARELTIFAPHMLGTDETIVDWAYQRDPDSLIWAVTSAGRLLSVTYSPDVEAQVYGWAQHDTDGYFESVGCLTDADGTNDEVYFVVRRTNSSGTVRFVERLMPRFRDDTVTLNKTYAVDAGLYYSGSPRQTFTGLGHLEGMDIVYLADGETLEGEAIVNGQLELSGPVSELSVGCIYTMEFIPSEFVPPAERGLALNRHRALVALRLFLEDSAGVSVGPKLAQTDSTLLETLDLEDDALFTGDVEVPLGNRAGDEPAVYVKVTSPYHAAITGMIAEIEVGDD